MQQIHFLVASHGMWGEPVHLTEMARIIREKFPEGSVDKDGIKLHILVAETNALDSTYDGIDWGGERIADEVQKGIEELEKDSEQKVTRFSVVGYSLGGLLSRYLIGVLNERKFFDTVKAVNFTTFASPHIGLVQTEFFFSKLGFKFGPKIMSRTGPQFYGLDSWSATGQPLIEVLADPRGTFYQGLAKFERLSLYGSAYGDRTVSYSTALIEGNDPFYNHEKNGMTMMMHDKYPPIVISYSIPTRPPTPEPKPAFGSRAYLRSAVPRVRLPPFLQFRFPLNALFIALLPLLIPMGLTAAFIKLSLDSSKSRKRLKLLEKDDNFKDRLVNVLRKMDKGMENAIAEFIDEAGEEEEDPTRKAENKAQLHIQDASEREEAESNDESPSPTKIQGEIRSPDANSAPGAPVFSPLQVKLVASLNQLPFNKYAACFPGVFSSHAVIISRDLKRFAFHQQGQAVLQHWADHFIL